MESADALGEQGLQGLTWIIRESDSVSKGTNAEWLDVGDARWLPRVLHPIFQEHRFYRVQKVKQTTNTPPTVSVQLSQSNPVTGFLRATALVSVADTNQSLYSVSIFVDGQRLGSMESFPSTNSGVWINSTEWPNGPHEIYAVATIADSAETTPADDYEADDTNAVVYAVGVSPSQFVTFSNYISQFFVAIPYFQAGQTQEVVAKFEEDSYWRVSVLDYQDVAVRQFEGQGNSCYAAWDGNDDFANPLPYGHYDYYIEARPSQYGPLSMSRSGSRSAMGIASYSTDADPTAIYKRTPAAMQFSRTNCDIIENIKIPSLNPTPPLELEALSLPIQPERVITFTVSEDGTTNEFINGVPAILYPPEPELNFERLSAMSKSDPQPLDAGADWADDTYTTYYPNRIPGNIFFGFAGSVGIGYQGHHPKKKDVGAFGTAPGGVLASQPPWGPLASASKIANGFSTDMGLAGWRTSFLKGDDNFNSLDLNPVMGPGTGTSTFATQCHFGLVVGHMTASAHNDPNYFATVPYVPFYNTAQPGAYQWIALPNMDFGKGSGSVNSKLKWIAFYGCQSLKQRDYSDLWTKFLLPMPPNLRMILGAEDGVYIDPRFGPLFADDMNGWTTQDGSPMTIFDAWCDAAGYAFAKESEKWWKHNFLHPMGNRHMSVIYRDTTQGASWNTLNDSIWSWGSDISYDWFDVSFTEVQVYP